jgi:hypothetical protein
MADYATVLRDHVTLTSRSVDRIFLQAYVPPLQSVGTSPAKGDSVPRVHGTPESEVNERGSVRGRTNRREQAEGHASWPEAPMSPGPVTPRG